MHFPGCIGLAGLVAVLVLCLSVAPVTAAFDTAYCSSQNTAGSDFQAMNDDYQSNGWCTDHCNAKGTYAFAVVLYKSCWCSNYIPKDQTNTGDCSSPCPGYPDEKCGNQDDNLYSYLRLNGDPSGTVGGSKPTSANSKSSTPTTLQTATSETPVTPQTSVVVSTVGGSVVTQTVLYTPTSSPIQRTQKSGSSNTTAIVGGVVGGIAGIAAIAGLLFFFLWRRRRNAEDSSSGVQRNTSTMSKSGLLRTEKPLQQPAPIMTNFNGRQSRNLDQDSISPISGSDRRNSRHLVDQRLNPSTVFMYDNSSQLSVGSVDDSRDYHRPLNVRNPDPES